MGVFCICRFCKNTIDFNRIKDTNDYLICDKCLDKVPNHVPESQQYYWLKKNKAGLLKR